QRGSCALRPSAACGGQLSCGSVHSLLRFEGAGEALTFDVEGRYETLESFRHPPDAVPDDQHERRDDQHLDQEGVREDADRRKEADIVTRHFDEWFFFHELRWTVEAKKGPAAGSVLRHHPAEYAEVSAPGLLVAHIGHGTEQIKIG
ncbi:hypothetical protein AB0A81_24430, partial [Streptomyces flaveolus]|uniref:hypothetical protein n=1 Tax=Streptomyces flaveolus TaxID=67297 RepID=UPI0033EC28CE